MSEIRKPRILTIDDNPSIHEDFRKILIADSDSQGLADAALAFFGAPEHSDVECSKLDIEIDSALQGKDGHQKVLAAVAEGNPYAMAFCDMRMPPGWDGLKTIEHLWKADPHLQVVICSAYSDHSWADIAKSLEHRNQLLILKKPFDNAEVMQMVVTLIEKRRLSCAVDDLQTELDQLQAQRLQPC